MTYQVGTFEPNRIAFAPDGLCGVVDYAYGLEGPSDVAENPDYYLDGTGVLICRHGAPRIHAELLKLDFVQHPVYGELPTAS